MKRTMFFLCCLLLPGLADAQTRYLKFFETPIQLGFNQSTAVAPVDSRRGWVDTALVIMPLSAIHTADTLFLEVQYDSAQGPRRWIIAKYRRCELTTPTILSHPLAATFTTVTWSVERTAGSFITTDTIFTVGDSLHFAKIPRGWGDGMQFMFYTTTIDTGVWPQLAGAPRYQTQTIDSLGRLHKPIKFTARSNVQQVRY